MTDALLVIDVQRNMFDPEPVHAADILLGRLTTLLEGARRRGVPVVFVRNNGGDGEPDEPGTVGWDIEPRLSPAKVEPVIDKWQSDSFTGTDLKALLSGSGVDTTVICGLQSEFCISASCLGAIQAGFDAIVVSDAHSTFDGDRPAPEIIAEVNDRCEQIAAVLKTADVVARW